MHIKYVARRRSWMRSKNYLTCINCPWCLTITPSHIDFHIIVSEKRLVTPKYLKRSKMHIKYVARRPSWIRSKNYLTCINCPWCLTIMPSHIDFHTSIIVSEERLVTPKYQNRPKMLIKYVARRPSWIRSKNYSMCINCPWWLTIRPSHIDFHVIVSEERLVTP